MVDVQGVWISRLGGRFPRYYADFRLSPEYDEIWRAGYEQCAREQARSRQLVVFEADPGFALIDGRVRKLGVESVSVEEAERRGWLVVRRDCSGGSGGAW